MEVSPEMKIEEQKDIIKDKEIGQMVKRKGSLKDKDIEAKIENHQVIIQLKKLV